MRAAYAHAGLSLFCRHNRFTADCPICSKGTVLDPQRQRATRPARRPAKRPQAAGRGDAAPAFTGPHASAGPYEDADGVRYLVRLEKVPGGVRLAEWAGSQLRRRAPGARRGRPCRAAAAAPPACCRRARTLADARSRPLDGPEGDGVSRGRSGDFKEELRVEELGDGRMRVARWVLRPGSGWELQDAPVDASRPAALRRGLRGGRQRLR